MEKKCPYCSGVLPQEANFCVHCGRKLTDEPEKVSQDEANTSVTDEDLLQDEEIKSTSSSEEDLFRAEFWGSQNTPDSGGWNSFSPKANDSPAVPEASEKTSTTDLRNYIMYDVNRNQTNIDDLYNNLLNKKPGFRVERPPKKKEPEKAVSESNIPVPEAPVYIPPVAPPILIPEPEEPKQEKKRRGFFRRVIKILSIVIVILSLFLGGVVFFEEPIQQHVGDYIDVSLVRETVVGIAEKLIKKYVMDEN